jgi:TrmH family RNA methyltransferase
MTATAPLRRVFALGLALLSPLSVAWAGEGPPVVDPAVKTGEKAPKDLALVIGNEGHGVHASIISKAKYKLTIPRYGGAESLNAAISTAIILDNLIKA